MTNADFDDANYPSQQGASASEIDGGAVDRAKAVPHISIQAFCEDQNTAQALEAAANDRRLAKATTTVQMGGVHSALAFYEDAPTPNLIILESLQEREALLAELDQLSEVCDADTRVIVIGHINDVALYRELIRLGVSEYIVAPFTPLMAMEAISSLYNAPETDPIGSVISFIGSKGGTGSSTVCHNVAWTISEIFQTNVVIADMDLPFGTAGLDFDQDPVQGIADAIAAPERLDEMLLERLLTKCSKHLSLFAAPSTLEKEYEIDTETCEAVLDVVRQNVPYIAVDLPHIWSPWAKNMLVRSDEIVITATPDLASLRNTRNIVEQLKALRSNDRAPLIVLNQVNMPKRPEISLKDFKTAVEIDPVSIIEFEAELFGNAANNAQMIEETSPSAKAADGFKALAYALTHREPVKTEEKDSLFGPLLDRFNLKKAAE